MRRLFFSAEREGRGIRRRAGLMPPKTMRIAKTNILTNCRISIILISRIIDLMSTPLSET